MHYSLVDLRLMMRVAETSSLTRAAAASHISLSAASTRIKGLEEALGSELLVRTSQGVTLTPAGLTLVRHARSVFLQIDHMQADLREFTSGVKGRLRLLANTTALSGHLPSVLTRYLLDNPDVSIDLQERLSHDIARSLTDGEADIGIVAGDICTDALETVSYRSDRLVLLVPSGHALAQAGTVSFADSLDFDHVVLHNGSAINAFLRQAGERMHRTLRVRIELGTPEAVCQMVDAGIGVAVLPEAVARRLVRGSGVAVLALSDPWATRAMLVCVRRFSALPPFVRSLFDLLTLDASPERRH